METINKKPKSGNLNSVPKSGNLNPNSNWSDLPTEVLQLIVKMLPFVDLLRFKAVSTSSLLLQNSYVSSPFYSPVPQTPWLMLPSDQEDDPNSRCFFSLSEKKVYKLNSLLDGFRGLVHYVGSSYGWLVIWDDNYNPTLLNPFSGAKFELPPTVSKNLVYPSARKSKELSIWMGIRKAILFSDPSRTENFVVAMLYGIGRLSFYKHGESNSWTHLTKNSRETRYHGITYHNDKLYALHEVGIDVWDFGNPFPTKVSTIELSRHMTLHKNRSASKNFRCYRSIVESMGELFFIYLLTFCNSSTSTRGHEIRIYKFNPGENTWEQQEDLCGRSLFIANHQIMAVCARDFPECEENSVYFADESDLGLYKLPINGDVMEQLFQQRKSNNYSPPCWIVPNF